MSGRVAGAIAVAAAIAGVALAGCGGSSAPPPLSVRQLQVRATAICTATARQTSQIASPTVPSAGASFLARGAALIGAEVRQLRALKPSAADAGAYQAAVTDLAEIAARLRSGARELKAGDPVIAMRALQRRLAPLQARGSSAWMALGIPACATV